MDGLFGKSESKVEIPPHIEAASKQALEMANQRNNVGYVPYYGPEQAAFTGQQIASMKGANQQARALGLPTAPVTFPTETDYGGGIVGYDSAGMMEDNLARLQQANPELFAALMALKDRQKATQQGQVGNAYQTNPQGDFMGNGGPSSPGNGGQASFGGLGGAFGGFVGDAFDGGGFGASGDSFSGGGMFSGLGNAFGGPSAFGGRKK